MSDQFEPRQRAEYEAVYIPAEQPEPDQKAVTLAQVFKEVITGQAPTSKLVNGILDWLQSGSSKPQDQ